MAYNGDSGVVVQAKRVQISDLDGIRQVFQMAYLTLEPSERSQRQTIKALIPEIYMLRDKGYSFADITKLMNSSIKNFQLQTSTVRIYFTEMLVGRVDVCISRMNEQMQMLSEVKKINSSSENARIAASAATILERRHGEGSKKVDEVFGLQKTIPNEGHVGHADFAAAPPPEKISAARSAAPPAPIGADIVGSEFGLTASVNQNSPSQVVVSNHENAFFSAPADIEPVEPIELTVSTDKTSDITCMPLRDGVKPLARRTDLGEDFYSDAILEHPAIPGLWLTLEARIYGALLEIDEAGKTWLESVTEKSFRIRWAKPIPASKSSTGDNFVKMDLSLFK